MTMREFADALGVTRARVHQLVQRVGLKLTKYGPAYMLTPAEREAIINRPRRPAGRPKKAQEVSA
jgi:predicted DNA-binding protein YlxM (UPF0122 family)